MADTFTSTTTTGFFSRIKNAIAGMLLGFVMVPGSIALLSWNEYRTIHRTQGLNEGVELVQSINDPTVASPELAGSLVHLNGKADTQERLRDKRFGVEENAIRLVRNVEMFQWVEHKTTKKEGNRETTEYSYEKKWAAGREDHTAFRKPRGHENPVEKFQAKIHEATKVNLGGYILNQSLNRSIHSEELVDWTEAIVESLPSKIRDHSKVDAQYLYWSAAGSPNVESPEPGDQRIAFNVVRPTNVSLVAGVKETTPEQLTPYTTTNGEQLQQLYVGDFTAAEVFEKMKSENAMWAWIWRGSGLMISFVGFTLIMGVLTAFSDSIPLIGSMARSVVGFVSFLLAIVLTTLTIAFAWIAVRPLIAIPLVVVGVVAAVMAWRSSSKKSTPVLVSADEAPAMLSSEDVV